MIKKLTPKQEALLPVYRDKWLKIGLSTETADHKKAESAVDDAYRVVGLKPPPKKIWAQSPLSGGIVYALIKNSYSVWDSVMASVWDSVMASVMASVRASVRASVWDSVMASVRASVWDSVMASVMASVWDSVMASVMDSVRASVWDSVRECGYGLHDAYWLGFYNYFLDVAKLEVCKELLPLMSLAENCGWWWPFEGAVILTEKPCFICRDDFDRLHHESRMAIAYPDGWGIYAWHGVRVPEWIITKPETITIEKINQEKNAEIRRILLERFGIQKWLNVMKSTEIQRDKYGSLVETTALADWDGEEELAKFVIVKDASTERQYALRVPPHTQTAHEGVASTFGQTVEQYKPTQEA